MSSRLTRATLAALLLGACSDREPGGPEPLSVSPSSARAGAATPVRIIGKAFHPLPRSNFDDEDQATVSFAFEARLGTQPLQAVRYLGATELSATVPSTLSVGSYDLTVVDPRGKRGLLAAAFRVTEPGDAGIDAPREQGPHDLPPSHDRLADQPHVDQRLVDARPPDQQRGDLPPCPGSPCPLGCNAARTRCNRLLPSNSLGVTDTIFASANRAWVVAGTATIDTDTGEIRDGTTTIRAGGGAGTIAGGVYWNTKTQAGAKELSILVLASLTVPASRTVEVRGARALAIYLTGNGQVDGTLRAVVGAASQSAPGPGGYGGGAHGASGASCFGGQGSGGAEVNGHHSGGGGGGRKAIGGKGGNASGGPASGGAGGGVTPASGGETLVPLLGGCGGGGGGGVDGGGGGGGGGALQISANGTLTIGAAGVVSAPGGGGGRGWAVGGSGAGGGGAGSGGAILLEAPTLLVSGLLAANGGGGGGADCGVGDGGEAGQDGRASTQAATGGACYGTGCSTGGSGGVLAAESGGAAANVSNCGGGGGGGAGRIRLNSQTPTVVGAGHATPAPSLASGSLAVW